MRVLTLCLCLLLLAPVARAQELTVFAAASLTDAMRDIGGAWEKAGHKPLKQSFSASSTLARQIEQGAPANLFASADEKWMDYLASRGLIAADTRADVLSNDLVLIVAADRATHVTIDKGFDLASLLGPNGRLATGNPAYVPAGIYAQQALTKLGLWSAVQGRLAPTEDVRGALQLVERGEAPAGIVYGTDAAVSRKVAIAGTFPAASHDPITYPFAGADEFSSRAGGEGDLHPARLQGGIGHSRRGRVAGHPADACRGRARGRLRSADRGRGRLAARPRPISGPRDTECRGTSAIGVAAGRDRLASVDRIRGSRPAGGPPPPMVWRAPRLHRGRSEPSLRGHDIPGHGARGAPRTRVGRPRP